MSSGPLGTEIPWKSLCAPHFAHGWNTVLQIIFIYRQSMNINKRQINLHVAEFIALLVPFFYQQIQGTILAFWGPLFFYVNNRAPNSTNGRDDCCSLLCWLRFSWAVKAALGTVVLKVPSMSLIVRIFPPVLSTSTLRCYHYVFPPPYSLNISFESL